MKLKHKNDKKSSIKTPVRDLIRNVFMVASAIMVTPLLFFFVIGMFDLAFGSMIFEWQNNPKIQRVIIEQCVMKEYKPQGYYYNSSTRREYYDNQFSSEVYIHCYRNSDNWFCTCEHSESE